MKVNNVGKNGLNYIALDFHIQYVDGLGGNTGRKYHLNFSLATNCVLEA